MRVRVCHRDEVAPGTMRAFAIDGLSIPVLVANLGDRFVASSGICPHEDVDLADGDIEGSVVSCPGHGYHFDLITGRCTHDPTLCLRRFAVILDGDDLIIDIDLLSGPS